MGCGASHKDTERTLDLSKIPIVVFVIGMSGSGKRTLCAKAAKELGWNHLNVRDIIAQEHLKTPASPHHKAIDDSLKTGKLVPGDIVVSLIKAEMSSKPGWETSDFFIDGFPRNIENLDTWKKNLGKTTHVAKVIYLVAKEETLEKRVKDKLHAAGKQYEKSLTFKKRFENFQRESKKVIAEYGKEKILKTIDAEKPFDEIYPEFLKHMEDVKAKPQVVFLLGGPGSGKGTQAVRIVRDFGFVHLSVGDLLRNEMKTGSPDAQKIDEYIKAGALVPAEIPVKLIRDAMVKGGWEKAKFLIDGFPRNMDNMEVWNKIIGDDADFKAVLFYDCSEEAMEKRILERAKTSGRSDDTPEVLKKRFQTYTSETKPVLEFYEKTGKVKRINAEASVEEVYASTLKILEPVFEKQEKVPVVFVLGGPGSGKGTQCAKIIADYGLVHLSVGDLLRDEQKNGTEIGKQVESLMKNGQLVPSEIPVKLVKEKMKSLGWGKNKFLLDGFPRNKENVEVWNREIGAAADIKAVLFYDCSLEAMEARMLERAKSSGRADDNPEVIKKRLATFQNESLPIVQYYEKEGLLYKISAEKTVELVYEETTKSLNKFFTKK